jgi:integrase
VPRAAFSSIHEARKLRDAGRLTQAWSRLTLDAYLDAWLTQVVAARAGATTVYGYRRTLRLYVRPLLGSKPLVRLATGDVQRLYRQLLDHGLEPSTVRYAHCILRAGLNDAVKHDHSARIPVDGVSQPRDRPSTRRSLTVEEAQRVLSAARHDRHEAVWVLALTSALRIGELLC